MTLLKEGTVEITANSCVTTITVVNTGSGSDVNYTISISASTDTIKIGGSYKSLSCLFTDKDGQDITETTIADMTTADFTWTCFIGDTEFTDNTSFITWRAGTSTNGKRIKLGSDYNYIGKTITIKCTVNGVTAAKDFEMTE